MSAKSAKFALRSRRVQQMRNGAESFLGSEFRQMIRDEEAAIRGRLQQLAQAARDALWRPTVIHPPGTSKKPDELKRFFHKPGAIPAPQSKPQIQRGSVTDKGSDCAVRDKPSLCSDLGSALDRIVTVGVNKRVYTKPSVGKVHV